MTMNSQVASVTTKLGCHAPRCIALDDFLSFPHFIHVVAVITSETLLERGQMCIYPFLPHPTTQMSLPCDADVAVVVVLW